MTKNQHALRIGLSLRKLTKTFREAVVASASAGYNFLWIDSLCIIQDSQEDWKRESMKMSDIYRNAAFTIVASAAWNGREGLFRTQDPLPSHPCVLGVRTHRETTRMTYAIPTQMDIEKTRRIELELCKWNRRGWCLQERALSRRILYFGESQLHFELKNDSGEVIRLESQTNERAYFQANRLRPGSSIASVYSSLMWWEYVNSYTQRQLTYRKDRPLAIQGLAVSMEQAGIPMFLPALRSEIDLHGVASNDFVASLLWYVDRDTTDRPSTEPENYPTWSWLSVDGVVFNDSANEVHGNSNLSVLEFVESDLIGNEDSDTIFAAGIKGLQLKVNGKLQKAAWKAMPNLFYFACHGGIDALCFSPPGYRDEELQFARELQKTSRSDPRWWPRSEGKFEYLEMIRPVSNDPGIGPKAHILQTQDGIAIGWIVPDTTDPLPEEIYCLEIRVEPVTAAEKHKLINTWVVRGLVLDRIRNRSETQLPVYTRIGFFELDPKHRGFLHPDLAFDWKFPPAEREGLRSNFLREWPDVDPHGFFEDVHEQVFTIS